MKLAVQLLQMRRLLARRSLASYSRGIRLGKSAPSTIEFESTPPQKASSLSTIATLQSVLGKEKSSDEKFSTEDLEFFSRFNNLPVLGGGEKTATTTAAKKPITKGPISFQTLKASVQAREKQLVEEEHRVKVELDTRKKEEFPSLFTLRSLTSYPLPILLIYFDLGFEGSSRAARNSSDDICSISFERRNHQIPISARVFSSANGTIVGPKIFSSHYPVPQPKSTTDDTSSSLKPHRGRQAAPAAPEYTATPTPYDDTNFDFIRELIEANGGHTRAIGIAILSDDLSKLFAQSTDISPADIVHSFCLMLEILGFQLQLSVSLEALMRLLPADPLQTDGCADDQQRLLLEEFNKAKVSKDVALNTKISSSGIVPAPRDSQAANSDNTQWVDFFQSRWHVLCRCASSLLIRGGSRSVTDALNDLIFPRGEILFLKLQILGSSALSCGYYSPLTNRARNFVASSLREVLSELVAIPSKIIIVIPTERSDRSSVRLLRTVAGKLGKSILVVYSSAIASQARSVDCVDPQMFWYELKRRLLAEPEHINVSYIHLKKTGQLPPKLPITLQKLVDHETIWLIREAAGRAVRKLLHYRDASLLKSLERSDGLMNRTLDDSNLPWRPTDEDLPSETAQGSNNNLSGEKPLDDWSTETAAVPSSQRTMDPLEAKEWLDKIFSNPKRLEAEVEKATSLRKWCCIQILSTNQDGFLRDANPFVSKIRAAVFVDYEGRKVIPLAEHTFSSLPASLMSAEADSELPFPWPDLSLYDVLVLHDAKRVLLHDFADNRPLRKFVSRGGKIWCVQYAEYLLTAERLRSNGNSLVTIADAHGLISSSEDSAVLFEPQTGGGGAFSIARKQLEKEVDLIKNIFEGQIERAVKGRQLCSLTLRMDFLLSMCDMEHRGIFLERSEIRRQFDAIESKLSSINSKLRFCTPSAIPADMAHLFDWTNRSYVRAYFFGGKVELGTNYVSGYDHASYHHQETPKERSVSLIGPEKISYVHPVTRDDHISEMISMLAVYSKILPNVAHDKIVRYYAQLQKIDSFDDCVERYQKLATYVRAAPRVITFDFEATGLNSVEDRITEFAFFDPNPLFTPESQSLSSFVNPEIPIPPRIMKLTGITYEEVKSAPPIRRILPKIIEFIGLSSLIPKDLTETPPEIPLPRPFVVLIAQNVFGVDAPLFQKAILEVYGPVISDRLLSCILFADSLPFFRMARAESRDDATGVMVSLRLNNLKDEYGIILPDSHRAASDSRLVWELMCRVVNCDPKSGEFANRKICRGLIATLGFNAERHSFSVSQLLNPYCSVSLDGAAKTVLPPATFKELSKGELTRSVLELLASEADIPAAKLLIEKDSIESQSATRAPILRQGPHGKILALHPDDCVRQFVDLSSTLTSRTISYSPCCQNIPKEDKSELRSVFTSRFGVHGVVAEVDYSQLEIAVMGILCKDPKLQVDLSSGVDFHCLNAAALSASADVLGKTFTYEEVFQGYLSNDPSFVKLRKQAKEYSFQRLFGAGPKLISKSTGLSLASIKHLIADESKRYPGMMSFNRKVRSVGLRPDNPGLPSHFEFVLPTGFRVSFNIRDLLLNLPTVKNYPIQGYGAELVQFSLGKLFRHFESKGYYDQKAFMTNFIHDSVWLDIHESVVDEVLENVTNIMSSLPTWMETTIPGVDVRIPLRVTATVGPRMSALKRWTPTKKKAVRK